ncbi:lysozyme inhibitor LprI family protein [Aestuariivirga sp.]|uniref:lysozyme inhibitor LprI family protein n=1 Tax=Aestuariivirga sp. TaxID=2650926 RepID=UPI00391BF253
MKIRLAVLSLLVFATPALAFDCAKARTEVEKAICADPALKQADDALGEAYAAAKSGLDPAGQAILAQSQKRWIARREFCSGMGEGMAACVRQQSEDRLSLLSGKPQGGPGAPGRLVPVLTVQDGTPQQWDIDIAAFRFAEPKTPGETAFNAAVDEIIQQAKLGPHGEDSQGMVYALQAGLSLTYASPRLISARHDFYVNQGGAHGNHGTSSINVDMASGRVLALGDVLAEPSAAILTLWCKKQIDAERARRVPEAGDVPYDEASRDATIAETVRDLSRWSIGEEEITVSFDPYAVGSYAEGSYECRFPTEGVKRMALPDAALP